MEFKSIEESETTEKALEATFLQIEEKKYEAAILAQGITNIDKLGVVFDGKRVWVKRSLES